MTVDIPQELRDRVTIVDHGEVEHRNPETGELSKSYVVAFAVVHDGVEHGFMLASTPATDVQQPFYAWMLEAGTYGVLAKAGLSP